MTFLAPFMLLSLLLAPILVGVYAYILNRKRRTVVRYTNVALVKLAIGRGAAIRRHLAPALLLIGAMFALAAAARPVAPLTLLSERSLVVLAIDASVSMRADDVAPDRITAARAAAKAFIANMPETMQVAVVAFAGSAALVQSPTTDREA